MSGTSDKAKHLKTLSDGALLESIHHLAREERRITLEILHHLREIERRRLYAERGFPSLFEYCRSELGYSEAAAQRRISSMRLLKEIPELEEKIESGKLTLTVVSQAQSFFRKEERLRMSFDSPTRVAPPWDMNAKREILSSLEGKSTREAEKELLAHSSNPEAHAVDRVRALSDSLTELKLTLDQNSMALLEQLRAALGHRVPNGEYKRVIEYALQFTLKKLTPQRTNVEATLTDQGTSPSLAPKRAIRRVSDDKNNGRAGSGAALGKLRPVSTLSLALPAPEVEQRRSPTAAISRLVFERDQSQCSYIDAQTQRRCLSRFQLELDHVIPFAKGGATSPENLRVLCRTHNQLMAAKAFGTRAMERFRKY